MISRSNQIRKDLLKSEQLKILEIISFQEVSKQILIFHKNIPNLYQKLDLLH